MNGKQKCDLLKSIRKEIAEKNNIVYLTSECNHEGNCMGTCPKCDAEIRYLDMEIKRKIQLGEEVFLSGITLDGINLEHFFSLEESSSEDFDFVMGDPCDDFEDFEETSDDDSCGAAKIEFCGVMEEYDTNISGDLSIEDMELSVRAYNCLKRAGITTANEILAKSWEEFFLIRNLGRKSADEILNKLTDLGFDTTLLQEQKRIYLNDIYK